MKLIPFGYMGGKFSKLGFILPRLVPQGKPVRHFVEACCGSAAVALNYQNPDVKVTTINDLNGDIANFFTVLRDKPEELQRLINLSPNSRAEYEAHRHADLSTYTDLEQARVFYCIMQQAYSSIPNSSWAPWARSVSISNRSGKTLNRNKKLPQLAAALMGVSIDNRPLLRIIDLYGKDDACLLYLDPPYLNCMAADYYRGEYENSEATHTDMLSACLKSPARIAISGYDTELYAAMLRDWQRHEFATLATMHPGNPTARTEVLWTNYEPNLELTLDLFQNQEVTHAE